MAYRLLYHPAVLREDLPNIPNDQRHRIRSSIERHFLEEPILAGKPLQQSLKGHRRLRVGDWRVIYRIERDAVIILKIGHRREVYQPAVKRLK